MRIRLPAEYEHILSHGRRASDAHLTLYAARSESALVRLGIAVGRRYGNAVQRNRIKRRIREAFRLMQHELPAGLDLVVMPRPAQCPPPAEIQNSIRALLPRLMAKLK